MNLNLCRLREGANRDLALGFTEELEIKQLYCVKANNADGGYPLRVFLEREGRG